jgi:hypothetical protein
MEAVQTSETLVSSYQSTHLYKPEDSHYRTQRRENLKSYLIFKDTFRTTKKKKRVTIKEISWLMLFNGIYRCFA